MVRRLEGHVFIDYRSEINHDEPQLAPQEKRRILQAVYGAEFRSGNPLINSVRDGSFTAPGMQETVYLIQKSGPIVLAPESLKGTTLAVFSGEHLVARVAATEFNFIPRLSDLNQDGINELLLQGSSYHRGTLVSWAKLVDLIDGQLRVIKDFDVLEKDSCGSRDTTAEIIVGVVRHTLPGQDTWPEFAVTYYRATCPTDEDRRKPEHFREEPTAILAR
jgi:hypothetical protein